MEQSLQHATPTGAEEAARAAALADPVEALRAQERAFRRRAERRKRKGLVQKWSSSVATYGGAAAGALASGAALLGQAGVSNQDAAVVLLVGSIFTAAAGRANLRDKSFRNRRSAQDYEQLADQVRRGVRDLKGESAVKLHDQLEDRENDLEAARLA